jgi:hypothetical protein
VIYDIKIIQFAISVLEMKLQTKSYVTKALLTINSVLGEMQYYGQSSTFSPPIPGTPVRLVHHQFPVDQADDLLNFPLL